MCVYKYSSFVHGTRIKVVETRRYRRDGNNKYAVSCARVRYSPIYAISGPGWRERDRVRPRHIRFVSRRAVAALQPIFDRNRGNGWVVIVAFLDRGTIFRRRPTRFVRFSGISTRVRTPGFRVATKTTAFFHTIVAYLITVSE